MYGMVDKEARKFGCKGIRNGSKDSVARVLARVIEAVGALV